MITVVAPMDEILHVEPGYYGRKSSPGPRRQVNMQDTLNCPCDHCRSRNQCDAYCVKFQCWVRKGKNYKSES